MLFNLMISSNSSLFTCNQMIQRYEPIGGNTGEEKKGKNVINDVYFGTCDVTLHMTSHQGSTI